MSAYRRHMAEYFAQKSENYSDASATHTPTDTATPNEYEPGLEPKGMVTFDEAVHAAEMKQGYNDRDDESIGMRHRGSHQQTMKDRRDESKGMTDSMNPHHPYSDVSTMSAQGYNDKMDESLGMRHRGKHQQSFKDRRDEASAMDKDHSMMGRKYDDVMTMDAEDIIITEDDTEYWLGTSDTLQEAIEVITTVANGEYTPKNLREDILDMREHSMMDAESAGTSGQGVPVSYGGIPLPADAVAELDAGQDDFGTVMSEMGAEAKLKPKKSSKPKYRQKGRAKSQGSQNDPCAKSDRACPLDANLWQRSKQRASKEYRVWPSPHASAYAVQLYNQAGGKWSRATGKKHPAAKSKNLNQNSLGNYYGGNYERKGEKGEAVDFSTRRVKTSSKGSAGDPFCGRAYTKDMTPEEFRKTYPRCLPKDGADNLSSRGQRKETLKKRNKLNKRKFTGGGGVAVPVDRKKNKSKKP